MLEPRHHRFAINVIAFDHALGAVTVIANIEVFERAGQVGLEIPGRFFDLTALDKGPDAVEQVHDPLAACIHHAGLFQGMSNPFEATRYHSLVIKRETFHHPDFVVSAWTDENEIMGVRHKSLPLEGVQFHPESVLTPEGDRLMANFMRMTAS